MVKLALFILKIFKIPACWWGADFDQLKALVKVKITSDFRRSPGISQSGKSKTSGMKSQLIGFAIIGLFIGLSLLRINDLMLAMTVSFSMMMVMLATTFVSDFTNVLFDERDNQIILPRPVGNRTLLIGRLFHIQFYSGVFAFTMAIISFFIILFKFNVWSALVFMMAVGLSTWITLLITTFCYLGLSKIVSTERLKDIVTYFQIVMAIVIFAGYQLLPKMVDMKALATTSLAIEWYTYLYPPAWVAGFIHLFTFSDLTIRTGILAFLAILIPLAGGWFMIRMLSGGFNRILSHQGIESVQKNEKTKQPGFLNRMYRMVCVSDMEIAGYKLLTTVTSRDRKFKQAVYPSYGFLVVFAFVMLKPDFSNLYDSLRDLNDSGKYVFFVMAAVFSLSPIFQIPYTDSPQAAWIYKVAPVKYHGHILTGALKAAYIRFFTPIAIVLSSVVILLWGASATPMILLSVSLVLLLSQLIVLIQKSELPFTQPREMQQKGAAVIRIFLLMFLAGVILAIVYFASKTPWWAIVLMSMAVIGLIAITFKLTRKKTFKLVWE